MSTITTRTAPRNARMALTGAFFGNADKAAAVMSALQPRMEQPAGPQADQPSPEAGEIAALEQRVANLEQRVEQLGNKAADTPAQASATAGEHSASMIDVRAAFSRMNSRVPASRSGVGRAGPDRQRQVAGR